MKRSLEKKHGNSYRARWFDEDGRRQSQCFSRKADRDAYLAAKKLEVREIKSGIRKRIFTDKTFWDLAKYYLDNIVPTKKSQKDLISILKTHLIPFFGNKKISIITQEHVNEFINSRLSNGASKKTVSNNVTLLITMLNLAFEMRWIAEVPNIKKPKVTKSTSYSYLRTNNEINRFAQAAKAQGKLPYALYTTAMLTGMRQGELAALRWRNVDLDRRMITVEKSFKGTTKNEKFRYVPINDKLLPILLDWKMQATNDLVFPSSVGKIFNKSAYIFQEIFKQVLDRAGFEKREHDGRIRHYICFHDLRHTFASHFMMNGGDIYKLKNILGHSSVEVTMMYAHLSPHIYQEDNSRFNQLQI